MSDEYYKDLDELEEMRYGSAGRNYIKVYVKDVLLFGGINEAIMYERLYRWAKLGKDPEGWVYKTKEEMCKETTLPRTTQDRARKNLERLGVLDVINKKPKGHNAPKLHYRMNKEGYKKLLAKSKPINPKQSNRNDLNRVNPNDPNRVNALYTTKDTTKDTRDSQQSSKADCDKTFNFSEKDLEMATLLADLIKNNNPDWQLKGGIKTWATHIEKLHRIDGRTYEQIEYTIRWTQRDDFVST